MWNSTWGSYIRRETPPSSPELPPLAKSRRLECEPGREVIDVDTDRVDTDMEDTRDPKRFRVRREWVGPFGLSKADVDLLEDCAEVDGEGVEEIKTLVRDIQLMLMSHCTTCTDREDTDREDLAGSMEHERPFQTLERAHQLRASRLNAADQLSKVLDMYRSAIRSSRLTRDINTTTQTYAMDLRECVDKLLSDATPPLSSPKKRRPPPSSKSPQRKRQCRERSTSPRKGPQRKKEGTQERGRASCKIKGLVSKVKYIQRYNKPKQHKGHQVKVREYQKEVKAIKHTQCYFVGFKGGCTITDCPFKHTPLLQAGTCSHKGTLSEWKERNGKGKSFGFITLDDGNKLFCPERAFGQQLPSIHVPCAIKGQNIEKPSKPGEEFISAKVTINETQKTGEPSPAT
jgi:hypothetical protein